jgi:hypothetical protein
MQTKRLKNHLKVSILVLGLSSLLSNCEKNTILEQDVNLEIHSDKIHVETVSFEEAINYFNSNANTNSYVAKGTNPLVLSANWSTLDQTDLPNTEALLTSAETLVNRKGKYSSKLFFIKIKGEMKSVIYTIYKDSIDEGGNIINARFFFNDLDGNYIDGYKIENASILKRYVIDNSKASKSASIFAKNDLPDDCWNTDTLELYAYGQLPIIVIFGSGRGSGGGSSGSSTSLGYYASVGGGSAEGSGTTTSYSNSNDPKLTNRNVQDIAGAILVEPTLFDEEDDKIINNLTGKALCVYNKLKTVNGNLFKETIASFMPDPTYDLILKNGNCTSTDEACTDGSLSSINGQITITIENDTQHGLGIAAAILHEAIHANMWRYIAQYKTGVDKNDKLEVFRWYKHYAPLYGDVFNPSPNTNPKNDIDHIYMNLHYIIPIERALRQLDNNRFLEEYYKAYAMEGLRGMDPYSTLSTDGYAEAVKLRGEVEKANKICE